MKEIAVGIMANMLCHEKVFLGIVEKQRYHIWLKYRFCSQDVFEVSETSSRMYFRYLEKLLRLLDVKDSPTLSLVFRWNFKQMLFTF